MIKKIFLMLFFKLLVVHSQQLEGTIYKELDSFLEHKTEEALQKLNQQEKIFENNVITKNEHVALVILQCNKAFFFKQENQIQQAIFTYENAWKRYSEQQLSDYDIIEFCLKPLGNLYTKTKDYSNAEYIIKHYIFLAEKEKKTSQKIAGIINLSTVYQSVNKHVLVIEMINEILLNYEIEEIQKKKLHNIKANSLLVMGLTANRELEEEDFYYLKYKKNLLKANYKEAKLFFEKFKNKKLSYIHDKRNRAKLFLEEAQLHMLLKEEEKANESLDAVLTFLLPNYQKTKLLKEDQLYAESLLIDVFDMKAVLETDVENILNYYDKSFYVANLIAQNITTQETKIILQASQRKRSEACILVLLDKYKITKEIALLERALIYADIGKSTILKNRLFKNKLLQKFPNDSLLKREKQLLKEQEILTNEVLEEQKKVNNFNKIANLNKEQSIVSIRIKETQSAIKIKYPRDDTKEIISLGSIRSRIEDKNTALVLYFSGKENMYQFIVDESTIKVNYIKQNSETEKAIINYIRLFNASVTINNNVGDFTEQAFGLYKLLKFDEVAMYENVVVIPDGILNFIPFETLLTTKTTTTFFANMPFVTKQQKIVYDFNLTMFINATSSIKNKNILGIFPVFKNTPKELKYSMEEARVIENNFSSIIFKNEKATKNNFINNLNKYAIIHLSTHSGNIPNATSSYISFYDANLTLNELYTQESIADLVVLSACETGVGTLLKGESPLSIARGFNYIGVDNLLFSLWKINDKSTAKLMKLFYKNYHKTNSISIANHQSKKNYLEDETIENSRKSPYYWGAFVYYGTPDFTAENNYILYIVLVITLLIIILRLFFRRRN